MDSYASRACVVARDALGVDDVAVVIGGGIETLWRVVESTGDQVRAIDDLQFDMGVGPVPVREGRSLVTAALGVMEETSAQSPETRA